VCGIAGCVLPPDRKPDRAVLERMGAALDHRGPDDSGIECIGSVGLVNRRLAIVDPSPAGHQPMAHPSRGWWLTYNGEVFNHLDLRAQLPGVAWRGGSDTETVLESLHAWGEGAIPKANGLYAYAALDQGRRRLLLVRDRFGVKPLYLSCHDGGVWFASEMRALLAAGVPRVARPDVLTHFTVRGWGNGRLTPIASIARVLPGTVVSIDLDSLDMVERNWYDPAEVVDAERSAALACLDREQALAMVEAELRAATWARLLADVPVGTMCSGGIDSGLVTAFARERHPAIQAYNASITDQPAWDEAGWARAVAGHLDVDLHTVECNARSWRAGLVETVAHNEYPLLHPNSVPIAQIAEKARAGGVKVLLTGEGADELFGGYPLHAQAWERTALRGRPARRALSELRWWSRRLRRLPGSTDARVEGPCPELNEYDRMMDARARAAYGFHDGARRELEGGLLADLRVYLPHLLNRQDKATMQRSVEARLPFLDPAVVALTLNLPLEARVLPYRKGVLRELAARHLPDGVAHRPKVGFGLEVGGYLEDAVRPEFLIGGRLRDVLGISRERWPEFMVSAAPALLMWTAEIWCRTVLDGTPVEEVEAALWRRP
jgi:asparagine synthase (glutamine-hydrolysing)